jgi:hypothetical protein
VRSPFEVNVHGTSCYERATPYCDEGFRFGHVLAGDGCQQVDGLVSSLCVEPAPHTLPQKRSNEDIVRLGSIWGAPLS